MKLFDVIALLGEIVVCGVIVGVLLLNPVVVEPNPPDPPPCPIPTPCPECPGEKESRVLKNYEVEKGDTLWGIAKKPGIYADPFLWPTIYWDPSNQGKINDPDLIYPNTRFGFPSFKDLSPEEKTKAINFAKTRCSWSLYDGE